MCVYIFIGYFSTATQNNKRFYCYQKKKKRKKQKKCEITDEGLKPDFNYCHTKHNNSHRQRFNY